MDGIGVSGNVSLDMNVQNVVGANRYDELKDKPKINDVEVSGSKSLDDYGIASKADAEKAASDAAAALENAETNATAIADETTRAKAVEQVNATAISDETTRATAAEQNNADAIAKVITYFPENVINVKNFGAVGDGTTDDTKAFKDAIDALKAKLDTTFFTIGQKMFVFEIPNGTYNIKSSITFPALGSAESTVSLTSGIFINGNCSTLLLNANDINFDGGYFIIENLSVKNAKNAFNFTHKFSPYVYISNVNVFSSVNGFSFAGGTYLCELNKCFVNATNTAYSFEESGISTTLVCCYAAGGTNGYVFNKYVYSSVINCAADDITNSYILTDCNMKLENCGAEKHVNYAVQLNGNTNATIEGFISVNGNTGIFKNNTNAAPYINNTQILGTNAKTIPIFTGTNDSSVLSNKYRGNLIANNINEYNTGIANNINDYNYALSGKLENTEDEFPFMNVPSQGFYVITVYGGQDIHISDKFIIYVQYSTLSVISSPTTNRYSVKRSIANPDNFVIKRDTDANPNIMVTVERIGSGYTTLNNS